MLLAAKSAFSGESIVVQLLQQLFTIGSDYFSLWIMDMHIDKAGYDQVAVIVGHSKLR